MVSLLLHFPLGTKWRLQKRPLVYFSNCSIITAAPLRHKVCCKFHQFVVTISVFINIKYIFVSFTANESRHLCIDLLKRYQVFLLTLCRDEPCQILAVRHFVEGLFCMDNKTLFFKRTPGKNVSKCQTFNDNYKPRRIAMSLFTSLKVDNFCSERM